MVWPFGDARELAWWKEQCRGRPPWYHVLEREELDAFVLALTERLRMRPFATSLDAALQHAAALVYKQVEFRDRDTDLNDIFKWGLLPRDGVVVLCDIGMAVRMCTEDVLRYRPRVWRRVWVVDNELRWMMMCDVAASHAVVEMEGAPRVRVG